MQKKTRIEKIAVLITNHIGTIEFFIICNLMVATTLILPRTLSVIQFISSAWLQLILLPLILIGQNIQSRDADIRAEEHYRHLHNHEEKIEKILKILTNEKTS